MPKFIMLVGLPASGKTTWAKEYSSKFHDLIHLESDAVREEMFGQDKDKYSRTKTNKVFEEMKNRTLIFLKQGLSVIYDATNMSYKDRRSILNQIPKNIERVAVTFAVPASVCRARDDVRVNRVGSDVIDKMMERFEMPLLKEGFDSCNIRYDEQSNESYEYIYSGLGVSDDIEEVARKDIPDIINFLTGKDSRLGERTKEFTVEESESELFNALSDHIHETYQNKNLPQDNPNHSFSVSKHCYHVWLEVLKKKQELQFKEKFEGIDWESLLTASILHDFGKAQTKKFENYKGEETKYAHYYNHENVSAYIAMMFVSRVNYIMREKYLDLENIVNLVQFHMKPYPYAQKEKKWKNLIDRRAFFKELEILNEADKSAK